MYSYIYIIYCAYIYILPLSLSLAISEFGSASGRSEQVKVVALISGTTVRTCKDITAFCFTEKLCKHPGTAQLEFQQAPFNDSNFL